MIQTGPNVVSATGQRLGNGVAEQSGNLAHVGAYRPVLHDAAGRLERLLDLVPQGRQRV